MTPDPSPELAPWSPHRVIDSHQQLANSGLRYWARMTQLAAGYGTDWLRAVLPPHRLAQIGPPPAAPSIPAASGTRSWLFDPPQWVNWYTQLAAWSAQQQVWTSRAYQALRDEITAGGIDRREIEVAARQFLRGRMTGYLGDVTDAGFGLVADGVSIGEESIEALSTAPLGRPSSDETTVEIVGAADGRGSVDLAIENDRRVDADVVCVAWPSGATQLAVDPDRFHLAVGQTRRVAITATLPDTATGEPAFIGRVAVTGHGDEPLTVRVQGRAAADGPRRRFSVRGLDRTPVVDFAPVEPG